MKQPSRVRAAPQRRGAPKQVILFIAANPPGTGELALDLEARLIQEELRRSADRDRFDFVTRWAAKPLDLLREIQDLRPVVVHFSGHGAAKAGESLHGRDGRRRSRSSPPALAAGRGRGRSRRGSRPDARTATRDVPDPASARGDAGGLYFRSEGGGAQFVSAEAIAETLKEAGQSVRFVVLNACFTDEIADAVVKHVECVVGMTGAIDDDAARCFAIGFYGALGARTSIASAVGQGRVVIKLYGQQGAELLQLKVRDGVDPDQLRLVQPAHDGDRKPPEIVPDAGSRRRARHVDCPYPGMRPYSAEEAEAFHGRDAEIDELIGRLRAGDREIYVIGPSGSGKSSLVAAGVLPRLARGVAGLGPFVIRTLRPGAQPLVRLEEALHSLPARSLVATDRTPAASDRRTRDPSVLLVVDQFEELFTLATTRARDAFFTALRPLLAERFFVAIFTLRADFFGAFMESPLWPNGGQDKLSRIEADPLRGEALRKAIEVPARHAGVAIEPELIERLLADTASEPGVLPLLQETMVQLWEKRSGPKLTLAAYLASGEGGRSGLAVAVARKADATLRRFTDPQTEVARRILLRLISFGEGRSDTRRQQPRAQLRTADDDAADFDVVLQQLVDDRLLTMNENGRGEPMVDLAHEILISAWPTLAGWIESHRADEQKRRQLSTAATQWAQLGRGVGGLLDRIELADAEAWLRTESARQLGHSADVIEFIEASRAEHARIDAEDRTQKTRLTISEHMSRHLLAEMYVESGRQLLLEGRPQEAIPYFLAARRSGLEEPPLRMLFEAAKRQLPLVPALDHRAAVASAAFSSDGTRVVTASWDQTAQVWDVATGNPVTRPFGHRERVVSAAFSPDGKCVVTASLDRTARIWDVSTGEPVGGPLEHRAELWSAAFSRDGRRVATASLDKTARVWDAATGAPLTPPLEHRDHVVNAAFSFDGLHVVTASSDGTARVWDAATGEPRTSPLVHQDKVHGAAFSRDGTRVVTASEDKTARVWDAATGEPVTGPLAHEDAVMSAAFSPDGKCVVTASWDNTARVWDAASATPLTRALEHQAPVWSAAFSIDGRRVVTASRDKTARVWDAATGTLLASPLDHGAEVWTAAFSPDDRCVVTASRDKTARLWDAATSKLLPGAFEQAAELMSAAFSPDGKCVVTASWDRTARVWDAATGRPVSAPLPHDAEVRNAVFSPDSTRVVTASSDHTARVWDAATGRPLTPPLQHQDQVVNVAFDTDGKRVVTASKDRTARVWDAATGDPLTRPLEHHDAVWSAVFSRDGTRVVTASSDRSARVWDAATGEPVTGRLEHQDAVRSAAFSPDGGRVVTASSDATARVWDAATGLPITNPLEHQDAVRSAVFCCHGTRVATASSDTTARVWDAETGLPLTSPLEHRDAVWCAAFSADGTRVVTASDDKTARVWDAATGKPLTTALPHHSWVVSATFSVDGTRVVTASYDKTARVWDVGLDMGTLEEWSAIAERSPFVLNGVALMRRPPRSRTE